MALFIDPKTGKTSATQDSTYNQNLDTYTPAAATPAQPSTPAPAPTTPTPTAPATPISTSDITAPKTNTSVNIQKQQKDLAGVQAALQDTSLYSKIASDGFINAAFNAAYGRNANADELAKVGTNQYGMGGLSVLDVVKKLKLDKYLKDYGMGAQDAGTQTSGTTGSVQTKSSGIQDMGKTGDPTRDTLADFFNEDIDEYEAAKNRLTGERQAVTDKSQVVNGIKAEIDTMKNELDYNQVLQTAAVANIKSDYYAQKDKIESRPVPMSDINKALNKMGNETNISLDKESIAAAVTNATNTYRYNSKLIEYNVALGDLQTAQQIAKDTAADIKEYKSEMLGIMSQVYQMDQNTRQLKQQEVDREYEMAMQGYTYVPNPTALQELAKKKGTDWVQANTTKIGGKIWIKPEKKLDLDYGVIGQEVDEWGNARNVYGFVDSSTGRVYPSSGGNVQTGNTNSYSNNGVVGNEAAGYYNIGAYATDPNHENAISSILNRIGKFNSVEEVDNYINSVAPGSPVTGSMVANTSQKYGVSWEYLVAMMQQDSSLGTAGKGARTFNPGNVGNNDRGDIVNFGNWQSGVDAVGSWLAKHKAQAPTGGPSGDSAVNTTLKSYAEEYKATGKMPSGLKPQMQAAVMQIAKNLPKATGEMIDVNTGIAPASGKIAGEKKDGLLALYDIQNKLEQAKKEFNEIAWTGLIPGVYGKIAPTKDQQEYTAIRDEIVDLIARARTGAALTVSEEAYYKSKLPGLFNETLFLGKDGEIMLDSLLNSVTGTLDTKLRGYGVDIIGRKVLDPNTNQWTTVQWTNE